MDVGAVFKITASQYLDLLRHPERHSFETDSVTGIGYPTVFSGESIWWVSVNHGSKKDAVGISPEEIQLLEDDGYGLIVRNVPPLLERLGITAYFVPNEED